MAEIAVNIREGGKAKINDIVESVSVYESERHWAEMLIRGNHPEYDLFFPELYSKYFVQMRIVKLFKNPSIAYIKNPEKPSRKMKSSNKVFYKDRQLIRFETPLQHSVYSDILKYFGKIYHESGIRLIETFPFGKQDLKKNFMVYIPDKEFNSWVDVKKLVRFNTTEKKEYITSIDLFRSAESLGISGKVKDIKSKKINNKLKEKFDQFSNDTDLMELVLNPDIEFPRLFNPVNKGVIDGI